MKLLFSFIVFFSILILTRPLAKFEKKITSEIKIIELAKKRYKVLVFLIVGINYFIIKPKKSVSDAFLLGIVIYGVYETTNYALLKNWSILTVIIDTLWGGILFAITTYIINLLR